jgi:cytosine/adenosine deaminase-related metal-dependent hydrolase
MTLDADWVATMAGPLIRYGRVVIEAGRILAVGPADEIPLAGEHRRLGESLLLPGLINAHCHLELSAYHGALAAGNLWSWLEELVALRRQPGASAKEQAAVPAAVQSMLRSGTTCVGDVSRAAWLQEFLAGSRIRQVCYIELISGARSPPADVDQLRRRLESLPSGDPLLAKGLGPHAPYTVTREDLLDCGDLAMRAALPLAMHLAETPEEVEWLRGGAGAVQRWHARLFKNPPRSPRTGPTRYALDAGLWRAAATALIHMNYADDWLDLFTVPADRRPVVVYCPRSHAFFGHEPHPFRTMLDAGLAVAVGTDSAASHPRDQSRPLSVLDELRWLHAHHPDVPAKTLLEMATVHAAAALGLSDRVGRLRPGGQADLVAFDMVPSHSADPLEAVLEGPGLPSLVCLAGKTLVPSRPGATG